MNAGLKSWVLAGIVAGAAAMGGCNQTTRNERDGIVLYQTGNYAQAGIAIKQSINPEKKNESYVLNNCRYGSCALAAGQFDEAQHAFLEAYRIINAGDVNDAGRQMQASVVFEGVKVWKGEPFERAMAQYYLGMLMLMNHDYENARAAFQNSLFSLREGEKDNPEKFSVVQSRFALGYFGLGFCNLRMNKPTVAEDNFKLAQQYDPKLAQLIADVQRPEVNGLVFIDAGHGPRKEPKGWYNEESVFGPTPAEVGPIMPPTVLVDGRPATRRGVAYDTIDTLAMAQDKHWMDIDTIKKFKAVVGTGAMAAGTGLAAAGAERRDKGMFWAGVGTAVVGAALAASSQSDLRYWELLPRTVYIVPVALAPGAHDVSVQIGNDHNLVHMEQPTPKPGETRDAVFYFRLR